jgi:hypothetical protein
MMGNAYGIWSLAALSFLLSACATITTGTTQTVDVSSSPDGAECTLTRAGAPLGTVTTPGVLTIKRGRIPISVVCTKDGYEDGQTVMNAQAEKATYGNALLGGMVGMAVDSSSGANGRYDPSVSIELTAMSAADQAAARAKKAGATPASPPANGPVGPSEYYGGVMLGYTEINLRTVKLRMTGEHAVGEVTQARCPDSGKIDLAIDPTGAVHGNMDVRKSGTCEPYPLRVEGRLDKDILKLTVTIADRAIPFSLTRSMPTPQTAGPFDGAYHGAYEFRRTGRGSFSVSEVVRMVTVDVTAGVGTGITEFALCKDPGHVRFTISSSGAVEGDIDLPDGSGCEPLRSKLHGKVEGDRLILETSFDSTRTPSELVLTRPSLNARTAP